MMTELHQPFALVELSDFASQGIVSKSIKKADQGNITFFAFGQNEQLSPHSAPYDAFIQILQGKADVTIGEQCYTMGPGQAVLMPANIPHAVKALTDMKMLLVMIKGS